MTTYTKGKPHGDVFENAVLNSYSYFLFSLIIPHENWYYHCRNVILIFDTLLADILADMAEICDFSPSSKQLKLFFQKLSFITLLLYFIM